LHSVGFFLIFASVFVPSKAPNYNFYDSFFRWARRITLEAIKFLIINYYPHGSTGFKEDGMDTGLKVMQEESEMSE